MMTRMIEKFANKKKITFQLIEDTEYTTTIRLERSETYFKNFHGLHKIVRISPFGKNDKVHTSLCKISVYGPKPEYKIFLNEKDIRVDFFKSTGPGGQHKNKTMSAVRLSHIPTGIIVTSDSSRSQHENRRYAYEQLQCKLELLLSEKNKQEAINKKKAELLNEEIIASYYFNHQLATQEKLGNKTKNLKQLFNGEIEDLFNI